MFTPSGGALASLAVEHKFLFRVFYIHIVLHTHTHTNICIFVFVMLHKDCSCFCPSSATLFLCTKLVLLKVIRAPQYSHEEIKPVLSADFKCNSWSLKPGTYHSWKYYLNTWTKSCKFHPGEKSLGAERDSWTPKSFRRTLGTRISSCCQWWAGLALP